MDLALFGCEELLTATPRGGVGFESITSYALRTGRGLIPPAAKLGKLELEPLYLGQRPGLALQHNQPCGCRHLLLQDENPLLPASSKDSTSIRRIRGRPSRIGSTLLSLFKTLRGHNRYHQRLSQEATRDRVSITTKPAPLQSRTSVKLSGLVGRGPHLGNRRQA